MSAAGLVSIETILAWACGERSRYSHSAPSSGLSSMNCPFPVSSLWSSKRLTGLPAPKSILPGRIFISLSFELLVGLGGVLAGFGADTTHRRHSGMVRRTRPQGCNCTPEVRCFGSPRNDEMGRFMRLASQLPDIPQGLFDDLALIRCQRRLRRDGVADWIALDLEPGLDAGRQV